MTEDDEMSDGKPYEPLDPELFFQRYCELLLEDVFRRVLERMLYGERDERSQPVE